MIAFLLHILLLVQGIPTPANQGGTITGVLMSEAKTPASGIRVGALAQPENPADVATATSLISIAETDEAGRFRLENIPPGRYYVTAGRVERPTYYPGTLEIGGGKSVVVAAGTTVSSVDFAMKDVSDRGVDTINAVLRIPIQIHTDAGMRIPVFSLFGKVSLRFTLQSDRSNTDIPLNTPTATLPLATGEYQVRIVNLPDGYTVSSMTFGSINLLSDTLKVTLADLPRPAAGERIALTPTQTGVTIQRRSSAAPSALQGPQQLIVAGNITASTDLSVSLTATPHAQIAAAGVNVRGKVENVGQQELYISGVPGTLYSDGTFEFRGVSPGRHLVAMFGSSVSSRQYGAIVTVGTEDVEDLTLQDALLLPLDVLSLPVRTLQSSPDLALHSIRGHVREQPGQRPVGGIITLRGYMRTQTTSLTADGEFEIPNLLPGSYDLRIETFSDNRSTLNRTIVVEDVDLELNLGVP